MPIISIDAIDDPLITAYRDLPHSRLPEQSKLFIAEGALLVERLLHSSFVVESLFVERPRAEEYLRQVDCDIPVYTADRHLLQQIVGFKFHRWIMACGRRRPTNPLHDVTANLRKDAIIVVCDAVQDSENLGAVLRNCAAFGVDAVLLGPRCADPFSRRALRVSMGAVLQIPLVSSADLANDLTRLKQHFHFQIVGSVLDLQASPVHSVRRSKRMALLFGNEANGLNSAVIESCDQLVTIPMATGTDSLNIAVASGIFLYQLTQPASDS